MNTTQHSTTQLKSNLTNWLQLFRVSVFTLILFTLFSCSVETENELNNKSSEISLIKSTIQEAENISIAHNNAIRYMYNYPDYSKLDPVQKVSVALSYLKIHKIDTTAKLDYNILYDLFKNVTNTDPESLHKYLKLKGVSNYIIENYIKSSSTNYIIQNNNNCTDTLNYIYNKIESDANLDTENKKALIYFFTVSKNSATIWQNLFAKQTNSSNSSVTQSCEDCLKNNWGNLAAIDGAGALLGVFVLNPLAMALNFSAASVFILCPQCNPGWEPPLQYDLPPCPDCPPPYVFDGMNCWLFSPPAGSNPWIANGYFYWSDPSQTCIPPGPPAFWDGTHCAFKFNAPLNYFGFIYDGGFYIKCP